MEVSKRQTVLITGASSGIGLALAKLFSSHGYNLVLVSTRRDDLERSATLLKRDNGVQDVYLLPKDLSRLASASEIHDELQAKGIAVDILVNNAGFGVSGSYSETKYDDQLNEINVNITSLSMLTHLFGADMAARKRGKILNISSCAAFQPGPYMAVYYASKAYVLSFSLAIREELKTKNVQVTVLCPGPTKTNFAKRARLKHEALFNKNAMDADAVALLGFNGLLSNKAIVITGLHNKVMAYGAKLLPFWLTTKVSGMINR